MACFTSCGVCCTSNFWQACGMIKERVSSLKNFYRFLLMFYKAGHIFSENNKCIQGSAVNYSIKEPHWPTVYFSCRGVQAAHLIVAVHTTFFLVVKFVYFFFSSILVSLFFRMHSGQVDDPLVFLWSNGQQSEIVCMVECMLCSFSSCNNCQW